MRILITGGASGLGEAITKKLALDESITVYFTYNKSAEAAKRLEGEFNNTRGIKCDFKIQQELDDLVNKMLDWDLDVLINNALTSINQNYFHKTEAGVFMESFQNNIIPIIKITQRAITIFRKNKFGKIINILTSNLINKPPISLSEYVANKAYLASLSKSWAVENASFNITSNCISPSFMQTKLTADTDQRVIEDMVNRHPLKRLLTVDEVADAVRLLVSYSQHLNGVNLIINAASDVI